MHLSDVRVSNRGSQKSEPQKSTAERIEFREGLRGRIMISVLSHFSEPFENTKRNQRFPDTAHARSCLIRNPAPEIEGKTIYNKRGEDIMHHNSIFE
jgi:hypothetical protein